MNKNFNKIDFNKKDLYNIVFALVEEEISQRLNPATYKDRKYDGTNISICGSSNLDIEPLNYAMKGGKSNYIPGKFDAVKYSFNVPLKLALKGSFERQQLFLQNLNK